MDGDWIKTERMNSRGLAVILCNHVHFTFGLALRTDSLWIWLTGFPVQQAGDFFYEFHGGWDINRCSRSRDKTLHTLDHLLCECFNLYMSTIF